MKLLLVLCAVASCTLAQSTENIDAILGMIFTQAPGGAVPENTPSPNTENRNPDFQPIPGVGTGAVEGTGTCECVPYYLCNNGTINKDGFGIIDIRIQDGPCTDYLSHCCEPDNRVVEPITPKPDINKAKGCGVRNPDGIGFRIKGDKDNEAQFGEFPWMVAILREEGVEGNAQKLLVYQCGASLIHPQVVLTSAHCVSSKDKRYKVRAGEWDTQTKSELFAHQDRDVETVIMHPEYYAGALFNDIALLILASPLDIVDNVDTICLPSQGDVIQDTRCFASGWGKDVFGKEGKYQVILKKIDLPIVPREVCQENLRTTRLGKHFILHKSFICAGGEAGKDTCKGDGGSPLICPIPGLPGKYYQAGIVAWGISCGEANIPGVYANVALFIDWIGQQLAYHNIDSTYYTY